MGYWSLPTSARAVCFCCTASPGSLTRCVGFWRRSGMMSVIAAAGPRAEPGFSSLVRVGAAPKPYTSIWDIHHQLIQSLQGASVVQWYKYLHVSISYRKQNHERSSFALVVVLIKDAIYCKQCRCACPSPHPHVLLNWFRSSHS